jgi:arginyl-tRNA synthetase
MNLLHLVQERFHAALAGLVPDPGPCAAMVKPAQDPKFGDYQFNGAMSLAKALSKKPRDIAQELLDRLPKDDLFEKTEIAGPGFINLRFRTEWLALQMQQIARGDRLGVQPVATPRTFVIDFSSPNVAKPMHVGHLRSTIIGDSLARLLRFLGHKVITDNHLGDWGLQIGKLLVGYKEHRNEAALQTDPVAELVRLYQLVQGQAEPAEKAEDKPAEAKKFNEEQLAQSRAVLQAARAETAKLQAGDAENVRLWKLFMDWSLAEADRVYRQLDVHFDHTLGESFYNPWLTGVVQDLLGRGVAHESKGAVAIFFNDKSEVADGPPQETEDSGGEQKGKAKIPPAVIRSSHGASTYTTTDLATIQHRMKEWSPNAVLYVVDLRQALHFKNLFAIARRWGFGDVEFTHISFGSVLGADGKPIKTRAGIAITLQQLLEEAVEHADQSYLLTREERQQRGEDVPELSKDERQKVAEAVGLGAVKYADLSQNRESDYVFDWDKMLAMDGNTATYMQYAYARCRSIFRKGEEDPDLYRKHPPAVYLQQPQERALALQLLRFDEALEAAAADYRPNAITSYLWDLAKTYSGFFQNCPVLKAETPALRTSRLLLCDLTARTIQQGLDLLGIRTIERM